MQTNNSAVAPVQIATDTTKTGLNVCVFCSANDLPEHYTQPAETFARLLAEAGHTLVWGGSKKGMMQLIADGARAGGARLIGVSVEFLKHMAYTEADELVMTKDLGERKAGLLARSDVVVTLVGGLGTLDELSEIIEHKRHGHHDKPIIILNSGGFYDGLRSQLQRMADEGFLTRQLADLVTFVDTPEQAIAAVNATPRLA